MRIEQGASAYESNRRRDIEKYRAGVAMRVRTYRLRWGRPDRNQNDRMLRELGRKLGLKNKDAVQRYLRGGGE